MRYLTFYVVFLLNIQSNVYGNRDVFTSSSSFSMGGAGFLFPSLNAQIRNPAVYNKIREFTTSIVKYPAGINSQSIGLNLPLANSVFSSSLKYVSYGIFEGFNERGEYTGNYKSYESWIDGYLSKKIKSYPVSFGSNMRLKSSNFNSSKITNISLSIGGMWFFGNIKNAIGFSLHHFGGDLKNKKLYYNVPNYVLSGSKKLKYLPAVVYIDFFFDHKNNTEIFMGSCFSLKNNLKFATGTSTRKFDQNTSQDIIKTILGSTGFGLIYGSKQIVVQYGIYYYGVGASVNGLNIGIYF